MDPHEILQTLAEVSVALTGFIGITAVFRQRAEAWSPFDLNSVRFMLEMTLSALLFSLTPPILWNLGLSGPVLWQVTCALLAGGLVFLFIVQERRRSRMRELYRPLRHVRGRAGWLTLYWIVTGVLAVNVFAPLPSITAGIYLMGTGTFLVSASIEFLVFVASSPVHLDGEMDASSGPGTLEETAD